PSHLAAFFLTSFPTRRSSDLDVAAVRALPNGVAVFREDQTALDIGEQLSVSFLVHFFNLADFLKQKRDVVKALFARGLCKARIQDRKSTRLNSSHVSISYAVF